MYWKILHYKPHFGASKCDALCIVLYRQQLLLLCSSSNVLQLCGSNTTSSARRQVAVKMENMEMWSPLDHLIISYHHIILLSLIIINVFFNTYMEGFYHQFSSHYNVTFIIIIVFLKIDNHILTFVVTHRYHHFIDILLPESPCSSVRSSVRPWH